MYTQRPSLYLRPQRTSSVLHAESTFPAILSWGRRDVVSAVDQDGQKTKETRWTTLRLDMHAKSAVLSNGRITHRGRAKPAAASTPAPAPAGNSRRKMHRRSSFSELQAGAANRQRRQSIAMSKVQATTAKAAEKDAPIVLCIGSVRSPSAGCFIARLRVQRDSSLLKRDGQSLEEGQSFELSFSTIDDEPLAAAAAEQQLSQRRSRERAQRRVRLAAEHRDRVGTSAVLRAAASHRGIQKKSGGGGEGEGEGKGSGERRCDHVPRWSPLQLTRPKTSSVGFTLNFDALAYHGEEDLAEWVVDAERLGGVRGSARVKFTGET